MLYDVADFFGDLGVVGVTLDPLDRRAMPENGLGEQIPIQIGPRIWSGTVQIKAYPHASANVLRARIARLTEADAAFLAYPPELPAGGQTGVLATIGTDRRQITLSGVTVAEGDYLGVTAGNVYGLHWVTAVNGSDVPVVPAIPRQILAGSVATTDQPKLAAVAVPGARGPRLRAVVSDEFAFSFVQTLRPVT